MRFEKLRPKHLFCNEQAWVTIPRPIHGTDIMEVKNMADKNAERMANERNIRKLLWLLKLDDLFDKTIQILTIPSSVALKEMTNKNWLWTATRITASDNTIMPDIMELFRVMGMA